MQKDYKQLTSLPFLASLIMLLVNDLVLKDCLHNYLTGKLSDFCGIFVFVMFWAVLFPKGKGLVFFSTAFLFILWKSPFSEEFISVFSNHIFPVRRVIDISDLMALLILPLAWKQLGSSQKVPWLNPWIAGLLTLFSFCATSLAKPIEEFKQPQYVLFESSNFLPDTAQYSEYYNDFRYHKFDTLIAIEVKTILLDKYPAKEDDYQKNLVLKDLDERVIREINSSKEGYYSLDKPLGDHKLVIDTDGKRDSVCFSGSRLNGKFVRTESTGKVLIKGQYKNGIEDSVWVFTDSIGSSVTKKTFKNGEAIKSEKYKNGNYISSETISTRLETVRNKYFQIIILLALAMGMIVLIVRNYRSVYPESVKYSTLEKILYPLTIPFAVTTAIYIFSQWIPDAYSAPFKVFGDLVLSFIITVPLFLIVFFIIRIRKRIDILWYILLVALLFSLVQELSQLRNLSVGLSQ